MNILHLLSSALNTGQFNSCLRIINNDDGILLCGDAVYALQASTNHLNDLLKTTASINIFALQEDVQARCIKELPDRVSSVDYLQFVDLCTRYNSVNSWL